MEIYFNILEYEIQDRDTYYISGPFALIIEDSIYWNEENATFILYGQEELFKFLNNLKKINSRILWFGKEFELLDKKIIIKEEDKND